MPSGKVGIMSKRKFAPDSDDRKPAATVVMTPAGPRRYDHRQVSVTVTHVRASTQPRRDPVPQDIREMLASEKALQASYNSLSHHLRMHRGCQQDNLAPNHGSILHSMWQKKQLTWMQLKGWQKFYIDLKGALGSSGSVVSSYSGGQAEGNYASRELQRETPGPSANWNDHSERLGQTWALLRRHERGLLEQLIRDTIRTEGYKDVHAHSLAYLGNILSGYSDNRQCNAAAVSAIQRLLTSIAENYGVTPENEDRDRGDAERREKQGRVRRCASICASFSDAEKTYPQDVDCD
jgi:hypothetical protein